MIKRIWGTCNGSDVIYAHEGGERWETAVPAAEDATYIIELWAEDEAGNRGYFATIKIAYDTSKLCFTVEIVELGAGFTVEDVCRALAGDRFAAEYRMTGVGLCVTDDPVQCQITRCEVCGQ